MTEKPTPLRRRSKAPQLLRTLPGGDGPSDNGTGDTRELPWIDAGDRNLPRITQAAVDALIAANDPPSLFWYGGMLSRLDRDDMGIPLLRQLSDDRCRHAMARAATWLRQEKKAGWVPALPPTYVVKDILASPSLQFPTLNRVVEVPVYAADGTLGETPGYSPSSKTFYAPVDGFTLPPIPDAPTDEQIAEARQFITEDLLGGFPFVGPSELANAVALFLEPFVRDLIDGPTPLRVVDAPSPGSGKGLLASVLLIPAIGREPAIMTAPRDDDEWRKRIFAALRTSPAAILIDNLTGNLSSGTLAAALTGTWFEDRVLGISELARIPIRCCWVATANNVTMSTEIARRTVRIRLDAKVDKPWQRTGFAHDDLREWTRASRAQLVWSGLTLVRAWLNAGKPLGEARLGSYERWSAVMGGLLQTIGIPGFLDNLEELYETADAEGSMLRNFVLAWFDKHGYDEVGVGDLFEVAGTVEGFYLGKGNDRAQRTYFGTQLVKLRDRIIEGYCVTFTREYRRTKRWRLILADRMNEGQVFETEVHTLEDEVHTPELFDEDTDL